VSVCLPSYNYARFLGECMASVLAQTHGNFELIVVDDCSTDDSDRIIRSFSDSRIRYARNEANIGMVRNWNRCLSLARGDYVCFLCADDTFLPRKLEVQVDLLDRYPEVGLVHSDGYSIDAAGEATRLFRSRFPLDLQEYLSLDHIHVSPEEFKRLVAGYNYIHFSNAMFRRECYQAVGGFDEGFPYAADWDLWLRISLHYDVAYVTEPLSCERWHGDNRTLKMKRSGQAYADWYGVIKAAIARWPGPADELVLVKKQALRVVRDHLLPAIHEDYAQGRMVQVRRKIWLAIANDPSLLTDWLTVTTYLKSFLGKDGVSLLRKIKTFRFGGNCDIIIT
ncbi:MAG: glycosyltransferase, partial [Anaerolineae bacterium]